MTKKIDVSIIIPSYNVAPYIEQCLDSVREQTLENIEVICIDANSTDGTLELIQDYAIRDNRFKVIRSEKKSYGYQMNLGIQIARGKYIGIVESDDWAERQMYEQLFHEAEKTSAEIVKSNYYQYSTRHGIRDEYYEVFHNLPYNQVFNPDQFRNILLMSPSIWTGIYLKKFLDKNNIHFLESPGASFQDTGFIIKCLVCASKVLLLKEAYLHYRIDNMHSSVKSVSKVYCVCDEFYEVERFLSDKPDILDKYRKDLLAVQCERYCWNFYHIATDSRLDFLNRMHHDFKEAQQRNFLDERLFSTHNWKFLQMVLEQPEKINHFFGKKIIISIIFVLYPECCYDECIESIESQTLKNIEIVRTDVSNIRETIEKTAGKYLIFIDENVVYMQDSLERGIKKAFETEAELVVINGKFEFASESGLEGEQVYLRSLPFVQGENIFSAKNEPDDSLSFTLPVLSNRIYSKEYLENSNYADLFEYGWSGFKYLSLYYASRIICINKILFYSKISEYSAMERVTVLVESSEKIYINLHKKMEAENMKKSFYKSVVYAISIIIESIFSNANRRSIFDYLVNQQFLEKQIFAYGLTLCGDEDWVQILKGFRQALLMGNYIEQLKGYRFAGIQKPLYTGLKKKISIIVTYENPEMNIRNCLDSIISQNLSEIEIICVDTSLENDMCKGLPACTGTNPFIKVIHKPAYQPTAARNIGVCFAEGEYLLFMDSSDVLEENALSILYQKAMEERLDLLLFQADIFNDFFDKHEGNNNYMGTYSGQVFFEKIKQNGIEPMLSSLQMIRRGYFISCKLWFEPGIDCKDKICVFKNIINASNVGYIHEKLYLKRKTEKIHLPNRFYKIYERFVCYEELMKISSDPGNKSSVRQYGLNLSEQMLSETRTGWQLLDVAERFAFYGLPDGIRIRFRQAVIIWSKREERLETLQRCCQSEQKERLRLREELSASYENYQKQRDRLAAVQEWHQKEWKERLRLREELSASYESYQKQKDRLITVQQWYENERRERMQLMEKLRQEKLGQKRLHTKIDQMQMQNISNLLKLASESGKKAAIWGCGKIGMALLQKMIQEQIAVDYLIDQDLLKNHQKIHGYTIFAFDEVKDQVDIILVTSHKYFKSIQSMAEGKIVFDLMG